MLLRAWLMRVRIARCALALAGCMLIGPELGLCQQALAQGVRDIESKISQPVGPRGGVLMLPLTADRHGRQWPQTLELRSRNGPRIVGQVAWIMRAETRSQRLWTDDPRDLIIRPIQPQDDSTAVADDPVLGPYLLARLPRSGQGQLRLGQQTLNVQWHDVPGTPIPSALDGSDGANADRPALQLIPSPDRPDPVSPFEYWRWVLLADRMDLSPPPPFGSEVERLAAEHYAALWRIGLQRLSRGSQRIAQQCLELLTETAIDRRQPFAAWISDPVQISALLSVLMDARLEDAQVLSAAVEWIDRQPPVYVWPELEFGSQVRFAMISPTNEPHVATFRWSGGGEPPMGVRLEPGVLMQVSIDRPPLPQAPIIGMAPPPEPSLQTLSIETGGIEHEFGFGPRVVVAKPPGVFLRPLFPPLTLSDVQMRRVRLPAPDFATHVHLRRLGGRWELFFECHRGLLDDQPIPEQIVPEIVRTFSDLRGIEAVTLVIGPASGSDSPMIWLTIPEAGLWRLIQGENDGTLQIHRRSYRDRWLCRVVLPEQWFVQQNDLPQFGFVRSRFGSHQLETGPSASTPWRPEPGRIVIDARSWDDLPSADAENALSNEAASQSRDRAIPDQ